MKKILVIGITQLFIMCSTTTQFQVRDDFKSASEKEKTAFLKEQNATSNSKSVVILTKGFKGEKVTVKQNGKTIYSSYPITNLKKQYADSFSFSNTSNILISDQFSKEELLLENKKINAYKFIYIMKEASNGKTSYKVTLSNTLRPLQ